MSWLSNASRLFKKKQVLLDHEHFVVSLPKTISEDGEEDVSSDFEDEEADPIQQALRERNNLLSDADQEAQEIVASAKKTSEDIILDAYDRAADIRRAAYNEGFSAGNLEAQDIYERRLEEAKHELLEIKKELLTAREELFVKSESEMISLVIRTLQRMISRIREEDEELVTTLVHRSVSGLTHINHIVVRIAEADADKSESIRNKLMLGQERIDTVEIKVDETLKPGCCVVETDRGTINASLDLQLERVRRAFRSLIEEVDV
ncbi:MAG: FliH/SctL family protein [Bacillota bacterium]|nr:FliH/SctL family protein [Bacillota bacterium]